MGHLQRPGAEHLCSTPSWRCNPWMTPCPCATIIPSLLCLDIAMGSRGLVHAAPQDLSPKLPVLLPVPPHMYFIFSAPPSEISLVDIYMFITDGLGFSSQPRCSQKECINNYIAQRDNYCQSSLKKVFCLSSSDQAALSPATGKVNKSSTVVNP